MDLMTRRRALLVRVESGGRLPAEYQEVAYLGTVSSNAFAELNSEDYPEIYEKALDVYWGMELTAIHAESAVFGYQEEGWEIYLTNAVAHAWGRIDLIDPAAGTLLSVGVRYDCHAKFRSGTHKIRLFKYYSEAATPYPFSGNFNYMKLMDEDRIIAHLIPCIRKRDNKPGFYELIRGNFYPSVTSTQFTIPT